MDYKYIEQLIDRFFACETTLQEEQILRSFFAQENVPVHLLEYVDLFRFESVSKDMTLGEDFDKKMMTMIEKESGRKANVVSMRSRFAPLFKAAAVVAIVLTIGSAAEHSISVNTVNGVEDMTAINPYIRQENISAAIRVKNNSQAENRSADAVPSDSIILDKND